MSLDDEPAALIAAGSSLLVAGRLAEAERLFRRAAAAGGGDSRLLHTIGLVLLRHGQERAAAAVLSGAVAADRAAALPRFNLAMAHLVLGRDRSAMRSLREAIEREPSFAQAHLNLALLLLRYGRLAEGFAEMEWRFENGGSPAARAGRPQPLWDGSPAPGKTLLLCAEQGAGDVIQFLRFVPRVADLGLRILVECPPPLKRLAATCPGVAGTVGDMEPNESADLQFPLMSLPHRLGIGLDDLARGLPYLHVPAAAAAEVQEGEPLVSPSGRTLQVGVSWTGNPRNPKNDGRSVPVEALAPLGNVPGTSLVSLQYQDAGLPTEELSRCGIRSLGSRLGDFAAVAAVIDRLDLVITVDTVTAHLAGALGKPVWTLLPHAADWRWMTATSTCPWYSGMRLYRQPRAGAWAPVLARVEADLGALAASGAGRWRTTGRRRESGRSGSAAASTSSCT